MSLCFHVHQLSLPYIRIQTFLLGFSSRVADSPVQESIRVAEKSWVNANRNTFFSYISTLHCGTSSNSQKATISLTNHSSSPPVSSAAFYSITAFDSMGGQSGDPTVVSTSIALLQERFRKLQKMKEKREKEVLRLFSESEQIMPATSFEPARMSFQNNTIFPSRPPHQDSLSLGLDFYSKHANSQSMKTSPSTKLWSSGAAATVSPSYTSERSDVDTSLHL